MDDFTVVEGFATEVSCSHDKSQFILLCTPLQISDSQHEGEKPNIRIAITDGVREGYSGEFNSYLLSNSHSTHHFFSIFRSVVSRKKCISLEYEGGDLTMRVSSDEMSFSRLLHKVEPSTPFVQDILFSLLDIYSGHIAQVEKEKKRRLREVKIMEETISQESHDGSTVDTTDLPQTKRPKGLLEPRTKKRKARGILLK